MSGDSEITKPNGWTGGWVYSPRLSGSENHKGYRIFGGTKGYMIAEVMPIDPDGKEGDRIARMMTAAPSLYEALAELLEKVGCGRVLDCPVCAKARAALSAAEGGV